jgi:tetratricopeptide (TPR) repeat protein
LPRLKNAAWGRRWLPWLAALSLGCPSLPQVQASGPTEQFSVLMDTLLAGCYVAADSMSSRISEEYPGHPAALYAQQTVLYTRLLDSEDSTGRAEFLKLADSCARLCAEWRDAGREQPSLLAYLRGSALSSAGLLLMHTGGLIPGLQKLLAARHEFDAAIESDPHFYDAYLGRGTYRCAVAQHASVLGALPFMPDFESGLRDLWLAADSSRWSRWVALNALAWFVLNERDYDLADSICDVGLARFPGTRAFLQPKLAVYARQDHWAEAEEIGLRLLTVHLANPQNNGYELTTLYWRLMVCADSLGRPEDAEGYARSGLAVRRTADVERRRSKKTEAMRERVAQTSARSGGGNGGR